MGRLAYYFFILPLSYLPFPILYVVSDVLFFLLYYIIPYRKKVVRSNLTRVFPDSGINEIVQMEKEYYHHLCDITLEAIKGFSISEEALRKRYRITGHETTFGYFEEGKDIIIASCHCGNWEWAPLALPAYLKHQCVAIVTPLTNAFIGSKVRASRTKTGFTMVPKHDVKEFFEKNEGNPRAVFFLSDQSPSDPERAYWSDFLGIETPLQYGVEKYASSYNCPVFYIETKRIKRGYYQLDISLLVANPSITEYGEIIGIVNDRIARTIHDRPSHWLWSHRRWKHKKRDQN